ncbi:peptidylprolyl isomerase [Maricaulis sp. MIT060901]|uniref:peptidylprolyl isomerase n=1 Tax=Maricaulis sp. MIT060901 TaxID=3096993 RepID=UPI00399BDB27
MRFLLASLALGVAACQAPDEPECGAGCSDAPAMDGGVIGGLDFTDIPDWRAVDPEDVLVIETRTGVVYVELADQFAPNHAARMRQAARDGFYDGREFYRVIDGFVVQGGRGEEENSEVLPQYPALAAELAVASDSVTFTAMQDRDLYAPEVGHVDGFAVGRDGDQTWMLHCLGTMAMARDNDADSADVEFFIVIGHAPRYLDRNTTVFGRVLEGMDHIQAIRRGDAAVNSGVIADPAGRDPIVSMRVAADLPVDEQPRFEVMDTRGEAFFNAKDASRNRTHEWFINTPPPVIEACRMPAPVRRASGD